MLLILALTALRAACCSRAASSSLMRSGLQSLPKRSRSDSSNAHSAGGRHEAVKRTHDGQREGLKKLPFSPGPASLSSACPLLTSSEAGKLTTMFKCIARATSEQKSAHVKFACAAPGKESSCRS
eukprot:455958-Pleurochrysis_carterae.AAC.2